MRYSPFIGKIFSPHPALRSYITDYHVLNTTNSVPGPGMVKSIPFGLTGIIFCLHNTRMEVNLGMMEHKRLPEACVTGYFPIGYNNSFHFISPSLRGITLSITEKGVNQLLNLQMRELYLQFIDLELILGPEVRFLMDKLHGSRSYQETVSVLDDFFLKLLFRQKKEKHTFFRQVNQILTANSRMLSVMELADLMNLHERNLQRIFKEEVGLTPKEYLRLVRFIKIFRDISTNPHITIQDLIWSGRFYDQAHFIHEFQKVTSCSPMEFYRFFKKRDEWL
jgi:AraC-like DNA-binding protein